MVKRKSTMWQSVKIMIWGTLRRPFVGATIVALVSMRCIGAESNEEAPSMCQQITHPKTTWMYWSMAEDCTPCSSVEGCGYCFSTLQCQEGDASGPFEGPPCPDWVFSVESCPSEPDCMKVVDCSTCVGIPECAWCSKESKCMILEDTFSTDCGGTIFTLPCDEQREQSDNKSMNNDSLSTDLTHFIIL